MSRSLFQRRHAVLKGGVRQPLLIHEWVASNYNAERLTIPDTGAWSTHETGNFDFTANSDTNIIAYDDYIYFDGTAESTFAMNESAIAALDLGQSMVFEFDWYPEEKSDGWWFNLADFGAYCVVADNMCAFSIQQLCSYVGFNVKFYSNSWGTDNSLSTVSYTMVAHTAYTIRFEWFNDGETINMNWYINGEQLKEFSTTENTDLSWNRFDPEKTIYIGRGINAGFHYNKPWRFYSMRIYNYD